MVQPEIQGVVIVCPHCGTRYQLSAETLGAGRLVQCASCRQSWQATAPGGSIFTQFAAAEDSAIFDSDAEDELDAGFEAEQRRAAQVASLHVVPDVTEPAPVVVEEPPPKRLTIEAKPPTAEQQRMLSERRQAPKLRLPFAKMRRTARLGGLALLALLVGGGIAGRTEIVRQIPDLAGFYQVLGLGVNVIGLEFRNVHTLLALRDGVEVLTVDAHIVGVSQRRVIVPPVIVALIDGDGRTVYEWSVTPEARDLEAGEAVDFETTLTAPPDGVVTVRLTFTNGRGRTETPIALSAEPLETTH